MRILAAEPPGAENPPTLPPAARTLWQGMTPNTWQHLLPRCFLPGNIWLTSGLPDAGGGDEHRSARSLGHHAAVTARRRPGHFARLLLDRHRTSQSALHLCPSALGSEHLPVARLRTFLLGARNDDPLGSTTRSRAPCRSRCSRPVIAPTPSPGHATLLQHPLSLGLSQPLLEGDRRPQPHSPLSLSDRRSNAE